MTRRILASMTLVAALAFSVLPAAVAAQDAADPTDEDKPDKTLAGKVVSEVNEDGQVVYSLDIAGYGLVRLNFGPSWFGGPLSPFYALVGTTITIGGNVRDAMPNENASETARENKDPQVRVLTISDQKRTGGKPPWAGGPKDVGETHPGFEGWSQSQADKEPKPDKAAKPDKVAKVPPGQAKKADAQASKGKPDKPGNGPKIPRKDE
jgi:hypothetical protein